MKLNEVKVLYSSLKYTNFISEIISYKRKKFKIIVEKKSGGSSRVLVSIFLFTLNNIIKIADESDLQYNVNTYCFKDGISNDEKIKMLEQRLEQAKEFIKAIY